MVGWAMLITQTYYCIVKFVLMAAVQPAKLQSIYSYQTINVLVTSRDKCVNQVIVLCLVAMVNTVLGVVLVLFLFIVHFTIDQGTVVGISLFGNLTIFGFTLLYDLDNNFLGTFHA